MSPTSARPVRGQVAARSPGRAAPPRGGYPPDEFDVDYQPGRRRGAHRTATPGWLTQLPWLVVALVTAVTVVAVMLLVTGGAEPTAGTTTPTPPAATPSASKGGEAGATTDPAATDPAATDPAATDPAATDPAATGAPEPAADRSLRLVVLNGTRVSGLATGVGTELEELGWSVGTIANAPDKPVATTVVLYSADRHRATAAAVAADLGAAAEQDASAGGAVVVVVGTDRS